MAVVVRGQGRTSTLRRVLMSSGVPVAVPAARSRSATRWRYGPLLSLLDVVLRSALGEPSPIDPETAVDAVLSPIGGADTVGLRRLRRALRREELDAGGGRTSDGCWPPASSTPTSWPPWAPRPRRRGASRGRSRPVSRPPQVDADGELRWAPGVTAETVLWAMWAATGLARPGAHRAGRRPAGARADRDLDAVVALFDAAASYVDRLPQAGPRGVPRPHPRPGRPGDTLVARSPSDDTVSPC